MADLESAPTASRPPRVTAIRRARGGCGGGPARGGGAGAGGTRPALATDVRVHQAGSAVAGDPVSGSPRSPRRCGSVADAPRPAPSVAALAAGIGLLLALPGFAAERNPADAMLDRAREALRTHEFAGRVRLDWRDAVAPAGGDGESRHERRCAAAWPTVARRANGRAWIRTAHRLDDAVVRRPRSGGAEHRGRSTGHRSRPARRSPVGHPRLVVRHDRPRRRADRSRP